MPKAGPTTITTEAVIRSIERAGTTELLLQVQRWRPAEYRTAWPDYQAEWLAYAAQDAEAPRPAPTAADISHHDLVRRWISVGVQEPRQRRIVGLRMLTWWTGHERDGEPVHSWRGCGELMNCGAEAAELLFLVAVERLTTYLNREMVAGEPRARMAIAWAFRERGAGLCAATEGPARPTAAQELAEVPEGRIRAAWFG